MIFILSNKKKEAYTSFLVSTTTAGFKITIESQSHPLMRLYTSSISTSTASYSVDSFTKSTAMYLSPSRSDIISTIGKMQSSPLLMVRTFAPSRRANVKEFSSFSFDNGTIPSSSTNCFHP